MVKEFKKGENTALSQNFTTREFDCKGKGCCEKTLIDTDLIGILQQIRAHFGKAVIIPEISVTHSWERESAKKLKYLFIHLSSAIKFLRRRRKKEI